MSFFKSVYNFNTSLCNNLFVITDNQDKLLVINKPFEWDVNDIAFTGVKNSDYHILHLKPEDVVSKKYKINIITQERKVMDADKLNKTFIKKTVNIFKLGPLRNIHKVSLIDTKKNTTNSYQISQKHYDKLIVNNAEGKKLIIRFDKINNGYIFKFHNVKYKYDYMLCKKNNHIIEKKITWKKNE